jgi:microcystin-dependent protein
MSEPFLAEIRIFGFTFPPRGYAQCDGQILPINQNQSLYSLLGTTYGGDGRTSFGLPDLRGRTPIHEGSGSGGASFTLGQKVGEEAHALQTNEIPAHTHVAKASSDLADAPVPPGFILARSANELYHAATGLAQMRTGTLANTGSGQGHENMQPFLVINFCIALQGLFPSRN